MQNISGHKEIKGMKEDGREEIQSMRPLRLKRIQRIGNMALWIKTCAKSDGLSLNPRFHTVERTHSHKLSLDATHGLAFEK